MPQMLSIEALAVVDRNSFAGIVRAHGKAIGAFGVDEATFRRTQWSKRGSVHRFGFKRNPRDCHVRRKGHAVSGFCPDGYLPTPEAVARAAECWFTHQFAGLKLVSDPQPQTRQDNSIEAAVRVFSQPQVSEAWRHAFEQIANQTVQRLRNFLHQGLIKGYYFQDDGCHALSRDFWATSHADGVIEWQLCVR